MAADDRLPILFLTYTDDYAEDDKAEVVSEETNHPAGERDSGGSAKSSQAALARGRRCASTDLDGRPNGVSAKARSLGRNRRSPRCGKRVTSHWCPLAGSSRPVWTGAFGAKNALIHSANHALTQPARETADKREDRRQLRARLQAKGASQEVSRDPPALKLCIGPPQTGAGFGGACVRGGLHGFGDAPLFGTRLNTRSR